jgi:hypothetical protein
MNAAAWISTATTAQAHKTTEMGFATSADVHRADASAEIEPLAQGMGCVAPIGQKKFRGQGVQLDCEWFMHVAAEE